MLFQLGELSCRGELREPDVAHSSARSLRFRVASVTFESRYHRVQAGFPSSETDALHQDADKVARNSERGRRGLVVHCSENDRENGSYRWR